MDPVEQHASLSQLSQESVPLSAYDSRGSSPLTDLSSEDDSQPWFVTQSSEDGPMVTSRRPEEITVTSSPPPDAPLPAPLTWDAPPARAAGSNRSSRASSRSRSRGSSRSRPSSRPHSVVGRRNDEDEPVHARPTAVRRIDQLLSDAPSIPPTLHVSSPVASSSAQPPSISTYIPQTRRSSDSNISNGVQGAGSHIIHEQLKQEEVQDGSGSDPPLKRRRLSHSVVEQETVKTVESHTTTTITNPPTAPLLSTFTCPICFGPPTNATMTPCGHICCGNCLFTAVKSALRRVIGTEVARCPVCRAQIPNWDGKGGGVIGLQIQMMGTNRKVKG